MDEERVMMETRDESAPETAVTEQKVPEATEEQVKAPKKTKSTKTKTEGPKAPAGIDADILAKIANSQKLAAERDEAAKKKEAEEKARVKAEKAAARKKAAEDKKRGMAIPDRTDLRFLREFNMCRDLGCMAIVILDTTINKVLPGSYYKRPEQAREFFENGRGHKDPGTFVCLMDANRILDLY